MAAKKVKRATKESARPAPAARPASRGGGQPLIALLRGINVGGNKRVPMAELCSLAKKIGASHVESYIQSGNLVVVTELSPSAFETALERAIEKHFGFTVDVIVRSAGQWQRYAAGSPFRDAEDARPHLLHLGVTKAKPKPGALAALQPYAKAGERLHFEGDGLWIDFGGGVARSKLSPAVLDRAVGSTVTARNYRTVQKLWAMIGELDRVK
jgi:uncharacterized protein (DUF1697 family)